jgi:hypothetical protein
LYSPNGFEVRGLVKIGRDYFMPEQAARMLEPMQRSARERTGKRNLDLKGRTYYAVTGKIGG